MLFIKTAVVAALLALGVQAAPIDDAVNVFEPRCNGGYACQIVGYAPSGTGQCPDDWESQGLCGGCCVYDYYIPPPNPDSDGQTVYTCQPCS